MKYIFSSIYEGRIKLEYGMLLFPNIALFTETDNHFIFELFGATRKFQRLEKKKHKESSTLKYLNQFAPEQNKPLIEFRGIARAILNMSERKA